MAGPRESAIHALMMIESAVPALMGLFLNVNAGVLLTAIAALAHEATAAWDVAYAEPRRRVTPNEQHVHSFLEVIPFMGTAFLLVLHWDQARALVRAGDARPRFALQLKREPLPPGYLAAVVAAFVALIAVPYGEEFWRCYRANPTLAARPEPSEARTPTERLPEDSSARARAHIGSPGRPGRPLVE